MNPVLALRRVETRNIGPNGDKIKRDDPNRPTLITLDIAQRELCYSSGAVMELYTDIVVVNQSCTWSLMSGGENNTRLTYILNLNGAYTVQKYRGNDQQFYGEETYELL